MCVSTSNKIGERVEKKKNKHEQIRINVCVNGVIVYMSVDGASTTVDMAGTMGQ